MNTAGQERRICRIKRSRPVSRVLSRTVIPLGPPSPAGSSDLPGSRAGRAYGTLFGLAPGGVCRTGLLPDSWCALTAPFHPCLILRAATLRRQHRGHRRSALCCTFRRLAPPRRYLAPCPVEPGLSSPTASGGSDRPADSGRGAYGAAPPITRQSARRAQAAAQASRRASARS